MRVLIAEDDPVSRRILEAALVRWAHEVTIARDGREAWAVLQASDAPRLAILDWMMPEMDGLEICRALRRRAVSVPVYVILLTARGRKEDIVAGLEAGADDYITKPFDAQELRARIQVGVRMAELQGALGDRVRELEEAMGSIRRLRGMLPICSYCKRVRADRDYWQQVESYLTENTEARFSHGICPDCYEKVVRPELDALGRGAGAAGR